MQQSQNELDIPIVPLIDMAFQLIFFFVITGAEQTATFDETIKLAVAKYSPPAVGKMPDGVVINVRKDGTFNINNTDYTHNLSGLRNAVVSYKNSLPNPKSATAILRCDREAKYEAVDRVLEVVSGTKGAGITTIRIVAMATLDKSGR